MRALKLLFVPCFVALLVVACGGGSSSSTPNAGGSPLAFPLGFAIKEVVLGGSNDAFTISGTCTGTAQLNSQSAQASTFQSASAVAVVNMSTLYFSDCDPSLYDYSTDYYDANFVALGSIRTTGEYGVFLVPPSFPASVHVGDSGVIGTQSFFSDSSRAVSTGHDDISYVIEPDTADTAIAKLTIWSFGASGLQSIQHDNYRIWANGILIHVSSDIQILSDPPLHLVLTAKPNSNPGWVSSISPAGNSTSANVYTPITATFNKPMDASTINSSTFLVTTYSGVVSGTVTYRGRTATLIPDVPLHGGWVDARITTGAKDMDGLSLPNDYTWMFSVSVPPAVVFTLPANSATEVSTGTTISATFNQFLNQPGVTAASFTVKNGSQVVPGTVTYSNEVATFTPTSPLVTGTLYTATISASGAPASTPMLNDYSWSFTTFSGVASPLPPLSQSVAYQIDYAHSGYATFGSPLTFPASPTWSAPFAGAVSYPLIVGGKVFVIAAGAAGSKTAELYALDKQTGSVLWGPVVTSSDSIQWSAHAYDQGKIFVINFDGVLSSFDAASGQAGWSIQLPGGFTESPPTAVNGIVYLNGNSNLYAVSEASGKVIWSARVLGGSFGSPTVSADGVFVTYPCQAYKFSPISGANLWLYADACSGGGGGTSPLANGLLYMRGNWVSVPQEIIFDAATGAQTGTYTPSQTMPAFTTQTGFFMNAGSLNAYDLATNTLNWSFVGDGHLVSSPIVIDQVVFIGSSTGNVYALDATSGAQLWSNNAGAAIAVPNELYIFAPLAGFGAGEGYLVVPAGNVLSAWHLSGP